MIYVFSYLQLSVHSLLSFFVIKHNYCPAVLTRQFIDTQREENGALQDIHVYFSLKQHFS